MSQDKLPNIYATVSIDAIGEKTKSRWIGSFNVKRVLSHADVMEFERMYSRLIPKGVDPSEERRIQAATLAELTVRIVSGPSWWDSTQGGQLMVDMEPLYQLMIECSKEEKAWSDEIDKLASFGDGNIVKKSN